jgi:hypothetical protein
MKRRVLYWANTHLQEEYSLSISLLHFSCPSRIVRKMPVLLISFQRRWLLLHLIFHEVCSPRTWMCLLFRKTGYLCRLRDVLVVNSYLLFGAHWSHTSELKGYTRVFKLGANWEKEEAWSLLQPFHATSYVRGYLLNFVIVFNAWASNFWADDSVLKEVRRNHAVIILSRACRSGRLRLLPANEGNPRRHSATRHVTAIWCAPEV